MNLSPDNNSSDAFAEFELVFHQIFSPASAAPFLSAVGCGAPVAIPPVAGAPVVLDHDLRTSGAIIAGDPRSEDAA